MNILIVLIVVSLVVALGFLGAFIWAVKAGQFDDASTPSYRMLWDDTPTQKSDKKTNNVKSINNK
ncbi:cbb3-type cytochrome oxidase assembly protein CcoS [Marivirga sp. S37H4]|uniref:Cbb3-type cytochrome oxidase assembly protein CcoS n=1 Tax=Marivirga aurantiaca TaxID=2802615 RepID=A0A934X0T7_9BACT|nr:cbb3-type cytochrome oxidase assembly protein CcoS [Marivirga aurantiaca]MBK6266858.1 cbb3-type cytochrome oxidase assembly protein CcoS [Marivirga aurantiaca]